MGPLLAGLAVRMIGIHHGAPRYIWHPDVSKQVQMAIEAYSKTPNPREYFNDDVRLALYPYGSSILLAKAMQIRSELGGRAAVEKKDRWLWDYIFPPGRPSWSHTFSLGALHPGDHLIVAQDTSTALDDMLESLGPLRRAARM